MSSTAASAIFDALCTVLLVSYVYTLLEGPYLSYLLNRVGVASHLPVAMLLSLSSGVGETAL